MTPTLLARLSAYTVERFTDAKVIAMTTASELYVVGEAGEHRHVVAVRGDEPPICLTHDNCGAATAVIAHKLNHSLTEE